jgi:ribosomal protein S12 methylthiotransferase accessory factor
MPAMGITRVANVTGLDRIGIPVVMVCRPNSRSLAVAQGKGLDLASAEASGLMETVESYHAERITLPLKLGSYTDLRPAHRLVNVELLPRRSDSLFHPDRELLWIEGYDLLQKETVWVPYETVHTNYTVRQRSLGGNFLASSNGLAAGNHHLEAISHGICEVVERDAEMLWTLRCKEAEAGTRVDLDTVDDPDARALLEQYERAGVAAAVWELTSDVGIPAFRCTIVDRQANVARRPSAAGGSGCHPMRAMALLRALTEAAQSRLTVITGSRDDICRTDYTHLRNPDAFGQARAGVMAQTGTRSFEGPSFEGETFEEDIGWELERLRAVGVERVVVVDLTKPEFGIPVVRVVIPGLECLPGHEAPAYRPGPRARAVLKADA